MYYSIRFVGEVLSRVNEDALVAIITHPLTHQMLTDDIGGWSMDIWSSIGHHGVRALEEK